MSFQPSPRQRALGCQEQQLHTPTSLLKTVPQPLLLLLLLVCPEDLTSQEAGQGRESLSVAQCFLWPRRSQHRRSVLAGLSDWHCRGDDNLLSWTLGDVYRPPPPSPLLVCSGKIAALPCPPALQAILLSNNRSHLSTPLGSSPPSQS